MRRLLEFKKRESQNGVICQFLSFFAVVCKKSGLSCLAEGVGAGAVSFSAHTSCSGAQHNSACTGALPARAGPVASKHLSCMAAKKVSGRKKV